MNQENDTAENRFALLETKLVYQERTIKELGALVYEQGCVIDHMESMLKLISTKLKSMDAGAELPLPALERPPHY